MAVNPSYLHSDLTGQIIKVAYAVHKQLGTGHTEKVYEQALYSALLEAGLHVCPQVRAPIRDQATGRIISVKVTDLVVNDRVAVEIKTLPGGIRDEHRDQLAAWLRANGVIAVGLVLNFAATVTQSRVYEATCFDAVAKSTSRKERDG